MNSNGINHHGNTICNWNNFINAYTAQEFPIVSNYSDGLSDKNYIIVIYFDREKGGNYVYKMRMSDTQNKSEEQIIEAIQYFSGNTLSKEVYSI